MKVAILAGGKGTRMQEVGASKPKPLNEIGGQPVLWHIMRHYAVYGYKSFVIALGYMGERIKKYIVEYNSLSGNMTVNLKSGTVVPHGSTTLDWQIDLIDTGQDTMTGGRVKRLAPYLGRETFMLTWGDGVSNVDLRALCEFHRSHGKLATVTAVRPTARFGHLDIQDEKVMSFVEKPSSSEGWVNGAFFVLEPGVFDYIEGDSTSWEKGPMARLAQDGQLMAYKHEGFWQCMDTPRDKILLEEMWQSGFTPWKTWE